MESQLCSIYRPYLISALKGAARFTHSRSLPILQSLLLQGQTDRLHVSGTDLDSWTTLTIPAAINSEPFTIAVPHTAALEWLGQVKSDDIYLSLNHAAQVEFSASLGQVQSRFSCHSLPSEDYPILPVADNAQVFTVDATAFTAAAQAVLPFCSKFTRRNSWQRTTPAIFLSIEGSLLSLVACNGAAFGRQAVPLKESDLAAELNLAVTPSAIGNLLKLLKENPVEGDIEIAVTDKAVFFRAPAGSDTPVVSVSSRLLDIKGNFSKARASLAVVDGSITLNTGEVIRALRRLERIARQDSGRVELHLSKSSVVSLCAHSNETGTAYEELAASASGPKIEIAFNQKNLNDVLQVAKKSETISIEYRDDPLKVVCIAGVLLNPIKSYAVEEAERAARRAEQEAIAESADIQALADAVEERWATRHREQFWGNVAALRFKGLVEIGSQADLPPEIRGLDTAVLRGVQERIGLELEERGVIECLDRLADPTVACYEINQSWADAQLPDGEVERRARAHEVFAELAMAYIGSLRSTNKKAFAERLVAYYQGFAQGQYPVAGRTLSGTYEREVRSKITELMAQARSTVEATQSDRAGGGVA